MIRDLNAREGGIGEYAPFRGRIQVSSRIYLSEIFEGEQKIGGGSAPLICHEFDHFLRANAENLHELKNTTTRP